MFARAGRLLKCTRRACVSTHALLLCVRFCPCFWKVTNTQARCYLALSPILGSSPLTKRVILDL